MKNRIKNLKDFYVLWSTQSLSQLGSAMTQFALTLWIYEKTGSALSTAALTICTYAPYVIMSIFAGALTDKFDKKRTMLICDLFAALTTVLVFVLYKTDLLSMWHLYAINMVSGLMNTVQQPASEVAYTLIVPKDDYQKTSGLQQLSRSLISIGNPIISAALYALAGLDVVIAVDLFRENSRNQQQCKLRRKCSYPGKRGTCLFEKDTDDTPCDTVHVRRKPHCFGL